MQTLYKYRPASPRALALLVQADERERTATEYIADMLWARTPKESKIPRLSDFYPPRRNRRGNAQRPARAAIDAARMMFSRFGKGGQDDENCDA